MIRISLTSEDFRQLVRGKVIDKTFPHCKTVVRICLQDIGFDAMAVALYKAAHEKQFSGTSMASGLNELFNRLQKRAEEGDGDPQADS